MREESVTRYTCTDCSNYQFVTVWAGINNIKLSNIVLHCIFYLRQHSEMFHSRVRQSWIQRSRGQPLSWLTEVSSWTGDSGRWEPESRAPAMTCQMQWWTIPLASGQVTGRCWLGESNLEMKYNNRDKYRWYWYRYRYRYRHRHRHRHRHR